MEETVAELFSQAYRPDLRLEFPNRVEINRMFDKVEKRKIGDYEKDRFSRG